MKQGRKLLIIVAAVAGVVGVGLGVIIGYFGRGPGDSRAACNGPCLGEGVSDRIIEDGDPTITQKLIEQINAANIGHVLK